jgi:hypothetical protein
MLTGGIGDSLPHGTLRPLVFQATESVSFCLLPLFCARDSFVFNTFQSLCKNRGVREGNTIVAMKEAV